MNIQRREVDGTLNPDEPAAAQIFITTAAERTVFMYSKLIECTINAVFGAVILRMRGWTQSG